MNPAVALTIGKPVDEFTDAGGAMVAISWNALGRADLQRRFGAHFDGVTASGARKLGSRGRRPGFDSKDIQ